MILTLVNVLFVLVAVAMIVLILLQRGAGAAAGSGFGAGASATVFGARGASNFLSKSTAILAGLFFVLSLGMAVYLHKTRGGTAPEEDLGLMGAVPVTAPAGEVPAAATGDAAPAGDVPAIPAEVAPVATDSAAPVANDAATPATQEVETATPEVEAAKKDDNGG